MSEFGLERGYDEKQEVNEEEGLETGSEEKEADQDLESLISLFKEQCEHVYSDPDNKESLKELFADAREFIEPSNKQQWLKLLKDTKGALENEDDPQVIDDILREAKSEGATFQE
jgi:hypothetical protein